jgi:SAM-dependent methyltransferase
MPTEFYTKAFFEEHRTGARQSAEIVVPLVLELVPARSVVDVGCGDGTWLAVFQKLGVPEILGIDGEYVDREFLQIPQESFQTRDLAKPFVTGRTFDLAMSLEVAEHLPADCAAMFVECLTRLAPIVLFSAAIPFQGGTSHINEQWQDKWAALFKKQEYFPVDCIRKRVWENAAVEWWYAQNTLLFVRGNVLEKNLALKAEFERNSQNPLNLVHPRRYLGAIAATEPRRWGVRDASRLLLSSMKDAAKRRIQSIFSKSAP